MLLITKELAEAVVKAHTVHKSGYNECAHCGVEEVFNIEVHLPDFTIQHEPTCIVVRAKLLLEREWGLKDES